MSRTWILLLSVVAIAAFPPVANSECEHDCYEIDTMGGTLNGVPYCYWFEFITGRLVYDAGGGGLGGIPQDWECTGNYEDPDYPLYTQEVWKYDACEGPCPFAQRPQPVALTGGFIGVIGFGCYYCPG